MNWLRELRCWFVFRHLMERVGDVTTTNQQMWQCQLCAKTIVVDHKDMRWN